MDRIKACEEKFAALFGGKPNSGEGNDPELMQILQRLIFGEISYTGPLDDRMRELITCVVLSTYQCLPQLKAHTAAALNAGVSPLELREAIYSCMPFIGCPARSTPSPPWTRPSPRAASPSRWRARPA